MACGPLLYPKGARYAGSCECGVCCALNIMSAILVKERVPIKRSSRETSGIVAALAQDGNRCKGFRG